MYSIGVADQVAAFTSILTVSVDKLQTKCSFDSKEASVYIYRLAEAFHSTLCTVSKGQPFYTARENK